MSNQALLVKYGLSVGIQSFSARDSELQKYIFHSFQFIITENLHFWSICQTLQVEKLSVFSQTNVAI